MGDYRLRCINTAIKIFDKVGTDLFVDGVKIILEAWNGMPLSLRADMLEGVFGFIDIYRGKYSRSLLISQLKKHEPGDILNGGKLDLTQSGKNRFIHQIFKIYNDGVARKEYRLPIKF